MSSSIRCYGFRRRGLLLAAEQTFGALMPVAIVLHAVGDLSLGLHLHTRGESNNHDADAGLFEVSGHEVVDIHGLSRVPEVFLTSSVIADRPCIREAVSLAFWPILPMLLVDLAVVANATETL